MGGELTIGALARQAGVSTSMLRFYEREGLLRPAGRTAAGYRLYPQSALRTLLFIHRAQRLGFSLGDIRLFLEGRDTSSIGGAELRDLARQRLVDIERRLTELLVLRHELDLFLDDLTEQVDTGGDADAAALYRELLDHVCGHSGRQPGPASVAKLMARLGCSLADTELEAIFARLRGRHVHVWREQDGYAVLVPGSDPGVEQAMSRLAESEQACHAHGVPTVSTTDEGFLLQARGPNAFLFAQLFLALEASEA
ncbi:MAG: MerR family DNA-binding transcriptional regulator [Chromatiales bacterium]|nr:MerR family DNA-binding transcriptional regulator [Chromatiales bacterium]